MVDSAVIIPEGNGLTLGEVGLPDLLPSSIANDEKMRALAVAKEREMRRFLAKLPDILIWSAISRLEEPVLTHVAVMLHADWWDEEWTVAQKRAFLFRQITLHRKKGTPWAVEEAVSIVYGKAYVREWFEYGGPPGCFSLEVNVHEAGLTDGVVAKIEMMVEKYKRKSQHLCGVKFSMSSSGVTCIGCANFEDEILTVYPFTPEDASAAASPDSVASAVDLFEIYTLEERKT